MKVLVTADWHIGVLQFGKIGDDGRNSRLVDIEDTLDRIYNAAIEQKIDLFIHGGDVFHTNKPSPEEQLIFYRFFMKLHNAPFKSRIIIGNHDYNSKLGSSHALKLFQEMADDYHVKIYDQTTWEKFNLDDGDSLLVAFIPYKGSDPEWNKMFDFGSVGATAVVCHSHLEGAVVGAEPFEIRSDSVTRFSQLPVNHVWAGHFHKPQILSQSPMAFYPGSIQSVDFNERNDVKGVVIVDTKDNSYHPYGIKTRRFVQFDFVDRVDFTDTMIEDCKDAIVKINLSLDEKQCDKFDEVEIRNQLESFGVHNIASINLDVRRQEVRRNVEIKLEKTLKENFMSYANSMDFGEMRELIVKLGLEIIEQCQ